MDFSLCARLLSPNFLTLSSMIVSASFSSSTPIVAEVPVACPRPICLIMISVSCHRPLKRSYTLQKIEGMKLNQPFLLGASYMKLYYVITK